MSLIKLSKSALFSSISRIHWHRKIKIVRFWASQTALNNENSPRDMKSTLGLVVDCDVSRLCLKAFPIVFCISIYWIVQHGLNQEVTGRIKGSPLYLQSFSGAQILPLIMDLIVTGVSFLSGRNFFLFRYRFSKRWVCLQSLNLFEVFICKLIEVKKCKVGKPKGQPRLYPKLHLSKG